MSSCSNRSSLKGHKRSLDHLTSLLNCYPKGALEDTWFEAHWGGDDEVGDIIRRFLHMDYLRARLVLSSAEIYSGTITKSKHAKKVSNVEFDNFLLGMKEMFASESEVRSKRALSRDCVLRHHSLAFALYRFISRNFWTGWSTDSTDVESLAKGRKVSPSKRHAITSAQEKAISYAYAKGVRFVDLVEKCMKWFQYPPTQDESLIIGPVVSACMLVIQPLLFDLAQINLSTDSNHESNDDSDLKVSEAINGHPMIKMAREMRIQQEARLEKVRLRYALDRVELQASLKKVSRELMPYNDGYKENVSENVNELLANVDDDLLTCLVETYAKQLHDK